MRPFAAIALLFLASSASAEELRAGPAYAADLPNFAMVSPDFFRSAQPSETGVRLIAKLGVRTVLNLRRDPQPFERQAVEDAGMDYIYMPMSEWNPPTDAQLAVFLSIIKEPAVSPLLIHCQRGADRTGILSAIRRIEVDGWPARKAADEMVAFKGLSPRLILFVFQYYKRKFPAFEIPDLNELYPEFFAPDAAPQAP